MVAAEIRAIRLARGETQVQFAETIGVRQATISDWETGKHSPSPVLVRILRRLPHALD